MITTRELVQDNIAVHGLQWSAARMRKQGVPFAIAYWLAFGRAPKARLNPPHAYDAPRNCLTLAQWTVSAELLSA